MSPEIAVAAALEIAKLYIDYAQKAPAMTPEERAARWQEVNANAANADAMWERSKAIREGAGR